MFKLNSAQPAIIITGPTASGKSSLALSIASTMGGGLICCDSMQIYREMDIGTAKPDREEQNIVKHYLFDIKNFNDSFNVNDYANLARKTAQDLINSNIQPIFCGGTGQYVAALAEGIEYIQVPADKNLRKELEDEYDLYGGEKLLEKIKEFDAPTASRLAINDRKRIVRALEVWRQTGLGITEINRRSKLKGPERKYLVFVCNLPRPMLYERINQRVWQMIDAGLEEEVCKLYNAKPAPTSAFYTAIGYKEWLPYFNKEIGREEVIAKIQQNTRNYAKRQLSLLRAKDYVYWLNETSTDGRIEELKNILVGQNQYSFNL